MRTGKLLMAAVIAASLLAMTGTANASPGALGRARASTDRFHNINVAKDKGYALLTDKDGIACIDNPGVGGMGIHYAKGSLIDDPTEHPRQPELLVYQPLKNGHLRLVALEYVVFESAWKAAGHVGPPKLFGEKFELTPAGNRYGLPPFYELHAWVWKHNSRGLFDDWNPAVHCPVT
jgi:hypothetical protein